MDAKQLQFAPQRAFESELLFVPHAPSQDAADIASLAASQHATDIARRHALRTWALPMLTAAFLFTFATTLVHPRPGLRAASPALCASASSTSASPAALLFPASRAGEGGDEEEWTSTPRVHVFFGHVLLLCGYLLVPTAGVLLMRRARAHASMRRAVLSGHGRASVDALDYGLPTALDEAFSSAIAPAPAPDAAPHSTETATTRRGGAQAAWRCMRAALGPRATSAHMSLTRLVEASTTRVQWPPGPPHRQEAQCAVCLSDVTSEQHARILPCAHAFHIGCADLWLVTARRNSCPLCLSPVYAPDAAAGEPLLPLRRR